MSAKQRDTRRKTKQPSTVAVGASHAAVHSKGQPHRTPEKDDALPSVDEAAQNDEEIRPDRTAGQNRAIDQKRNDEQQYHAGGVAHDPHNQTQERVDSGDPDAGDVDEVSRSDSAPFNKTYGHHD